MNLNDAAIVAEELFVCDDPNYIVVFQLLDLDLSVHIHLVHYPRWWRRLWNSIKYVFRGGPSRHGYTINIKHTDADRMIAVLEKYKQKVHEKLTAVEEESAVGDWESEGGAVC